MNSKYWALMTLMTCAAGVAHGQTSYTVKELGTLRQCEYSAGGAVNDSGQVVGRTIKNGRWYTSFFWSQATGMVSMNFNMDRMSISKQGYVVAMQGDFVWENGKNGNMPMPLPGCSGVASMNDNGEIFGGATDHNLPMVWTKSGGTWAGEVLPVPFGFTHSGVGISSYDAATGQSRAAGFAAIVDPLTGLATEHALVRWMRDASGWRIESAVPYVDQGIYLGWVRFYSPAGDLAFCDSDGLAYTRFLRSSDTSFEHFFANPIQLDTRGGDDAGNLCGDALFGGMKNAARWDRQSWTVSSLGTLGGSSATAQSAEMEFTYRHMSPTGVIVGASLIAGDAAQHAFRARPGFAMEDLNYNGLTPNKVTFNYLKHANAISPNGMITGKGIIKKGGWARAFLLIPNP